MNRRKFIRNSGILAAGSIVAPTILPSGRLFASSGARSAKYVVYVLFAGGVRQQESVLQRYLEDSQGLPYEGNIMYNMFKGAPPSGKIAYGTGEGGIDPIPKILGKSLQEEGTLFKEVRSTTAGHYPGLNSLLQGNTALTQGLKKKPVNPTIFEYIRRHGGEPATKVWFIGNGIGNSTPLLNYSEHPEYGPKYGANFFAPNITFGSVGQKHLSNARVYHPEDQLDPIYHMKYFLDNSYDNYGKELPDLHNTDEEKQEIKTFMREMFKKTKVGSIAHPPVHNNPDSTTIGYTCEVLSWFKPTLTVVNLSNVDGCHSNFTGYLKNLHAADHSVGHLWDHIQSIPEMAGNTVLIATPECGRNLEPNAIKDEDNGWFAYDHSDANARRVFTLMAGSGIPQGMVVGNESNPVGITTDGVLTIAEILGIKNEVASSGLVAGDTMSLFDRM